MYRLKWTLDFKKTLLPTHQKKKKTTPAPVMTLKYPWIEKDTRQKRIKFYKQTGPRTVVYDYNG